MSEREREREREKQGEKQRQIKGGGFMIYKYFV